MTVTRTGPTERRRELADRARALAAEGYLQREIAVMLGISRSYASALASSDPLGEKTRVRKDGYRGVCEDCGAPTDGSYGPNNTPAVCDACSHLRQAADKTWTRDFVVLEQQEDGSWVAHEAVNAYSEALAIETYAEGVGAVNGRISHRFVAVPAHRWIVRELQPVTTFKAVVAEPVKA